MEYFQSFVVIGENSERRIVSSHKQSIDDCKAYIERAEALDKANNTVYYYNIAQFIKLS